ncbi:MAG TPA: YciI family protein [Polyangiales bacterium]
MIIVKATQDSEAGVMPSSAQLREMGNFNEELVKAGIMLAVEGLHPSSRAVRVRVGKDGKPSQVIDGPFAETKELVAGFWIWQCRSLDECLAWVKRAPFDQEAELEVRPVFEVDDFGDAATPEIREQERRLREQTAAR